MPITFGEWIEKPFTKDEIKAIIYQAKQEVFDDIEKLWEKCANTDIKEMILSDLKELKEKHL